MLLLTAAQRRVLCQFINQAASQGRWRFAEHVFLPSIDCGCTLQAVGSNRLAWIAAMVSTANMWWGMLLLVWCFWTKGSTVRQSLDSSTGRQLEQRANFLGCDLLHVNVPHLFIHDMAQSYHCVVWVYDGRHAVNTGHRHCNQKHLVYMY